MVAGAIYFYKIFLFFIVKFVTCFVNRLPESCTVSKTLVLNWTSIRR